MANPLLKTLCRVSSLLHRSTSFSREASVSVVTSSQGKSMFETEEIEPPKKEKWKTKKRLKLQRMREKKIRKSANKRDPRRLGVKGKKTKQRFGTAEERIKHKLENVPSEKMFLKSQLSWNVVIPAMNLDAEGLNLQKAILFRILDDFATKKASKDIGYFLAVTTLDRIGQGVVREYSGELLFPVDFSCITFKMLPGEIMEGRVHKILKHGVFLTCGPVEKVYMSLHKLADYQYVPGESPFFKNDKASNIENGTLIRFVVLAEKYDEGEKDFRVLVSLDGDHLGPVS